VDKKILEIIKSARIGYLATASSYLQPYLTPVVFIVLQNRIFIPLDDKPKTIDVKELRGIAISNIHAITEAVNGIPI
jgi:hypothetical protein